MEDLYDLEWVAESTVRFSVYDFDVSDDDDTNMTVAPCLVTYAVSIHKARAVRRRDRGLEVAIDIVFWCR